MFSFSKGFGMVGNRLGLVYTKKPQRADGLDRYNGSEHAGMVS